MAFPSTLFIMSISAIVIQSAWNIEQMPYATYMYPTINSDPTLYPATVLLLTGGLVQGLCWLLVMMSSVFYRYHSNTRRLASNHSNRRCSWAFYGAARKISVLPIILSLVGWSVLISRVPINNGFSAVVVITVASLLCVAMLLHALASTISGVFACILSVTYTSVTFVSLAILVIDCDDYSLCGSGVHTIIGGGVASYFFVSCVHSLWPFYLHYPSASEEDRNSPQPQQGLAGIPPPSYGSYGTIQGQQYTSSETQLLIIK